MNLFPEQKDKMKEHMKYILNNLDGVKNQNDEDYKVSCSMGGHVNQAFARYITSSLYDFSEHGLENKLKLLVYHANKIELTNIKYDQKLTSNHSLDYSINVSLSRFDSNKDNNYMNYIQNFNKIKGIGIYYLLLLSYNLIN